MLDEVVTVKGVLEARARLAARTYSAALAYGAMFLGSSPVLGAKLLWKTAAPHRVRFFFWLLLAQEVLDWGSEISIWSTAFKILSPQGRANAIASEGRVLGLGRVQAAGPRRRRELRRQRDANWRDGGGMAWHKLELGRPGRAWRWCGAAQQAFSSSIVR